MRAAPRSTASTCGRSRCGPADSWGCCPNTATGGKTAWVALGGTVGLCLAIANIVLAFFEFSHPRMLMDLLAVTFALWALGWMVGPTFAGEAPLNGQHFHRQPIPRGTLALGLLASALVAVTTVVTLLAFTSLIVFAPG
ncbi:hypothetical protein [Streptosporangium roseum]|uniref:hypothetical protein n=1 Tax=Streptosporangium roseum TaxID=2001 RepID=UPI00331B2DBB